MLNLWSSTYVSVGLECKVPSSPGFGVKKVVQPPSKSSFLTGGSEAMIPKKPQKSMQKNCFILQHTAGGKEKFQGVLAMSNSKCQIDDEGELGTCPTTMCIIDVLLLAIV